MPESAPPARLQPHRTPRVGLIHYGAAGVRSEPDAHPESCRPAAEGVTWVHTDGLTDPERVLALGRQFGLHPLTVEDILQTGQRPKLEDYGDYLYVVLRTLEYQNHRLRSEQVSLLLGRGWVLSFSERPDPLFDGVRSRLKNGNGLARRSGADFLFYALLDLVVDDYFVELERIGQDMDGIEAELGARPSNEVLRRLQRFRRQLTRLRGTVWPLRDLTAQLLRLDSALLGPETRLYLRDVADHAMRAIDMVETFRDVLAGMQEIYLANVTQRTNNVMKLLAAITTIFMPLTLITGVFGMNFDFIPGLHRQWGFWLVMGGMLGLSSLMLWLFRRKEWL